MVEWFHERYISRAEHQEIVDYYKKLVVQLHRKVCELRSHVDIAVAAAEPAGHTPGSVSAPGPTQQQQHYGGNVVSFETRRRARLHDAVHPGSN